MKIWLARKAQVNIDFISGFFLFIIVVLFISFSVSQRFPQYISHANDNSIRLMAWQASENLMQAAEKNGELDTDLIANISSCVQYDYSNAFSRSNYSYVKQLMDVGDLNGVHITIDAFFFGITDLGNSSERSGTVLIWGTSYDAYIRNTSGYFNEAKGSTGPWSNKTVFYGMGGSDPYDVFKIDYEGEYVILKKRLVDCGPKAPAYLANTVVKRYSTYEKSMAMAEITYW